jgi:hypothetical protein
VRRLRHRQERDKGPFVPFSKAAAGRPVRVPSSEESGASQRSAWGDSAPAIPGVVVALTVAADPA